jgi:hypothetical protein
MANDINLTGRAAKGFFLEVLKAKGGAEKYNERRKDATKKLRDAVTKVWAALEAGETVNGFAEKKDWAKWLNPTAKHPEHWIQSLVSGKDTNKAKSLRVVKVVSGMVLQFGKRKFKLVTVGDITVPADYEDEDGLHEIEPQYRHGSTHNCQLNLEEIPAPEKKPTQKERLQAARKFKHGIDPATFGPAHKARTLCGLPVKPLETANLYDAKRITCPECTPLIEEANAKCREILQKATQQRKKQTVTVVLKEASPTPADQKQ